MKIWTFRKYENLQFFGKILFLDSLNFYKFLSILFVYLLL
jgi:hypothetical protein